MSLPAIMVDKRFNLQSTTHLCSFAPVALLCAPCNMLSNEAAVLLQLREDVTRYRYGDEQHLDESLTKIFMFNRVCPVMTVTHSVCQSLYDESIGQNTDRYCIELSIVKPLSAIQHCHVHNLIAGRLCCALLHLPMQ